MKVEIIEKPEQAKETPFVVGGVYRCVARSGDDGSATTLVLIRKGETEQYAWFDPQRGDGVWDGWNDKKRIIEDINDPSDPLVYVPNARLVVDLTK